MEKVKLDLAASNGYKIPAVLCEADKSKIRGLVVICHGFGEHSGSYGELQERLYDSGYASVIYDQRGHGELFVDKKRGVIPDYSFFLSDLQTAAAGMKDKFPGTPLVLYGHSMGGNIAANFLLAYAPCFSCAVLESPWFGLAQKISPVMAFFVKLFSRISPNLAMTSKLEMEKVTGDAEKLNFMINDALYHNRISFRMLDGIMEACEKAVKEAPGITLPVFLAVAEKEQIVCNEAIKKFFEKCNANVEMKEYDSLHAIHHDVNREVYLRDLIEFINKHCPEK